MTDTRHLSWGLSKGHPAHTAAHGTHGGVISLYLPPTRAPKPPPYKGAVRYKGTESYQKRDDLNGEKGVRRK